ncbi:type VI secretion system-associated protein VasI [Thioalkalivibrio sp. ALE20]|uniref:type VI secretion system-associated protein VasI n=1 Tax=Thioalkalivibrio sp. ALE20 TaxID=545275 RepID=UPI001E3EFCFE|nr:type VI secretion system-associated protein VasI [Thioalkalivibrio sp. ALE20]
MRHGNAARLLLLPLAWAAGLLQASESVGPEAVSACVEIEARADRLACYDDLFRSESGDPGASHPAPPLWEVVERQEARRATDDHRLSVGEYEEVVLLTAPALGTPPPRPRLVVACYSDITHFQVHLPLPASAGRVDMELVQDGTRIQQTWRVRDGGRVVSGGRGLPAIATLRQLLAGGNLELGSEALPALDGLRFEIDDLAEAIRPLRAKCRW